MFDFLPEWLNIIIAVVLITIWIKHLAGDVFEEKIKELGIGASEEELEGELWDLEERVKKLEAKLKK